MVKGLETACQERVTAAMSGNDARLSTPNHEKIDALSLADVQAAIVSQLGSDAVEVSICGDAPMAVLEGLALNYLGTVPPRAEKRAPQAPPAVKPLARGEQLAVYLQDSDERAMGYCAGPCPNRWGLLADGTSLTDALTKLTKKKDERRSHPLFGHAALLVLQEVGCRDCFNSIFCSASTPPARRSGPSPSPLAQPLLNRSRPLSPPLPPLQVANRRLFSVVREERRLTYDASFQLHGHDAILGGWYLVSVTSSPQQVQAAVAACKEALASLQGPFGVMPDSVQSAKRAILNRFNGEAQTNKFWVESMSGTQLDCIPLKSLCCVQDFEAVLSGITTLDVQQVVEVLDFCEANITSCVGVASPTPPKK